MGQGDSATVEMIRRSGRSWWQARYSSGLIISEWDTLEGGTRLPLGKGRSSRWEETPKDHMVGLRLLCPNGMAGELAAPEGCLFFQLKSGGQEIIMGFDGSVKEAGKRYQDAHIIGVVKDAEGNCLCRAWETVVEIDEKGKTTQTIPPGTRYLIDSTKNWQKNGGRDPLLGKTIHIQGQTDNQKRTIWGAHGNRLTIQPWPAQAWTTYLPNNKEYLITSLHRRLIEFTDNIHDMRYRNIGPLRLDVQGLKV